MIALVIWALGAGVHAASAPWWIQGLLVLPAVLWAPGAPWARRLLGSGSPLQAGVDAVWISIALVVPGVCLVRWLGGGPWLLICISGIWAGLGLWLNSPEESEWTPKVLLGLGGAAVFLSLFAGAHSPRLSRGLDTWWHDTRIDARLGDSVEWSLGDGWSAEQRFGWPEDRPAALGAHLSDADGDGGTLQVQGTGTIAVLLQGPVGARITLSQGTDSWDTSETWGGSDSATIESDPVVDEAEGPVPRYQERGAAAAMLDVQPGELQIAVDSVQEPVRITVLPGRLAVDSLDVSGEARFVHYYQLLNIVENQRWAAEVLESRALTINQPPLWSYVLAVPTLLIGSDLQAAGMLFLWVLFFVAASGLALVEVAAPRAPWPAWLLPGLFAAVHGKLMLVPGSINFPDSLYAAAIVGGCAALLRQGPGRIALLCLSAGLLRYPGTVLLTLIALLLGKRTPWRGLVLLWACVGAVASLVGLGALVQGSFSEWLSILWFETIPEHYSNNPDAAPIWSRPLDFYQTWFLYMGGALVLALPLAPRNARWLASAAGVASAMLCTIDHLTTHYFLPLIALSAVAIAANSEGLKFRIFRIFAPLAALVAGGLFIVGGIV